MVKALFIGRLMSYEKDSEQGTGPQIFVPSPRPMGGIEAVHVQGV